MIMNGTGFFGIIRLWNDLKYVDGVRRLSEKISAERIAREGSRRCGITNFSKPLDGFAG